MISYLQGIMTSAFFQIEHGSLIGWGFKFNSLLPFITLLVSLVVSPSVRQGHLTWNSQRDMEIVEASSKNRCSLWWCLLLQGIFSCLLKQLCACAYGYTCMWIFIWILSGISICTGFLGWYLFIFKYKFFESETKQVRRIFLLSTLDLVLG